jgi:HEAT repeat protein
MAVCLALGRIGGPRTVETLILALKDKNTDIRIAAAQSLGKIGTGEAVESLKHALGDTSKEVRWKAIHALAFLGNISAVEPLLEALRNKDPEVRRGAAESLGYLGSYNKTAERMIRKALSKIDGKIREDADHAVKIMDEEKDHNRLYAELIEEAPRYK